MSEPLPDFRLLRVASIDEAVSVLASDPGARLLAGGTDLVTNLRHGLVETRTLIDLGGVDELGVVEETDAGLTIGCGVTLRELAETAEIAQDFNAVAQAAVSIAGPAHREAGTLGGNLCLDTRCLYYNQSHWWRKSNDYCLKYRGTICHVAPRGKLCHAAYCGDLAPALMVHGAEVTIAGPSGRRRISLAGLFGEDGMDYLTLGAGEMLVALHLPRGPVRSEYEKLRVRGSIDFPLAGVAVAQASATGGLKLAFTGIGPKPVLIETLPRPRRDGARDPFLADL
ncbi:MAG: FAD binding domain-containing protein, partial [Paracoccaceae bacterium]